jgi:transposase
MTSRAQPVYFIGVDVGKSFLDVAIKDGKTWKYTNSSEGISCLLKEHSSVLEQGFLVLEATGGYEAALLVALLERGYRVHRADPEKSSKNLVSLNKNKKTDRSDAKGLARYAFERHDILPLAQMGDADQQKLSRLVRRGQDYIRSITAEKNRLKSPLYVDLKEDVEGLMKELQARLAALDDTIKAFLKANAKLSEKAKICQQVSGVGSLVALNLLAFFPELGKLSRREVAALAGVAPRVKESGSTSHKRSVRGGRRIIKTHLYMAALSACRSEKGFKDFYDRLIAKGKEPIVAMTAVARKIITTVNAKLKDIFFEKNAQTG